MFLDFPKKMGRFQIYKTIFISQFNCQIQNLLYKSGLKFIYTNRFIAISNNFIYEQRFVQKLEVIYSIMEIPN